VPTADELLGTGTVDDLVACLERAAPGAPLTALRSCGAAFGALAFGERVTAVADATLADLPDDLGDFDAVLRRALEDPAFAGWMIWAVAEAAARRALGSPDGDALEVGLELLRLLTPRHSSEAAIRGLLDRDADRALAVVLRWTGDPDPHVRRLASEGTRPFLPWARRVPALAGRPEATIPILDALYRDPSEYVRRSVANHLNDLSRVDPALVVATARRWQAAPDAATPWVVRHALRTLVKRGDPAALALHGFAPPTDDLRVAGPVLDADVVPGGGELTFSLTVENTAAEPVSLAIDYVVHYRKANGTTAPKVFKLATTTLGPGASESWTRTRSFRPITTRRHHPGGHAIELQVNGRRYGRAAFELLAED